MFVYNVTFITRDWHITTTVRHEAEDEENIITAAAGFLYQTARMNVNDFRLVDVDVDYVGEENNV